MFNNISHTGLRSTLQFRSPFQAVLLVCTASIALFVLPSSAHALLPGECQPDTGTGKVYCGTEDGGVDVFNPADADVIPEKAPVDPDASSGYGYPRPGTPGATGWENGRYGGGSGGGGAAGGAAPTREVNNDKSPGTSPGVYNFLGDDEKAAGIPYVASMSNVLDKKLLAIKGQSGKTVTFQVTNQKAFAGSDPLYNAIRMTFTLTGGTFEKCRSLASGGAGFSCTLRGDSFDPSRVLGSGGSTGGGSWPWHMLVMPGIMLPSEALHGPDIPICIGSVKDGGPGQNTDFTVADANCKSNAFTHSKPVRLQFITTWMNPKDGFGYDRAGGITYEGKTGAAGNYWVALAYAMTAGGRSSLPFPLVVRNRYAPTCESGWKDTEATRSLETIVAEPSKPMCKDADVDEYQRFSHDKLRFEITKPPAHGAAWVDAHGRVRYQSVAHYVGKDELNVKAIDQFDLESNEITIPIDVVDVRPSCHNVGAYTLKNTPVNLRLQCALHTPEPIVFLSPLTYSAVKPEHGTLGPINQITGEVEYTPDPDFHGIETFTYTGDNNGAQRDAQATVVVNTP